MEKCRKCRKNSVEFRVSKWCSDCWYPGIDEDYQEYLELLDEGYRRADAAVRSGWQDAEEAGAGQ